MNNREGLIAPVSDVQSRLFDPGPSDAEQRFIDKKTDVLHDEVPAELRVYPTKNSKYVESTEIVDFGKYTDFFVDPYMPDRELYTINIADAREAGEWLLSRGYLMTEGVVVHRAQTSWSVGSIAVTELTGGRGIIADILSNTTVIGPYAQVTGGEYHLKLNGVGLWTTKPIVRSATSKHT